MPDDSRNVHNLFEKKIMFYVPLEENVKQIFYNFSLAYLLFWFDSNNLFLLL